MNQLEFINAFLLKTETAYNKKAFNESELEKKIIWQRFIKEIKEARRTLLKLGFSFDDYVTTGKVTTGEIFVHKEEITTINDYVIK